MKRFATLLLILCMLAGMLCVSAFTDAPEADEASAEQTEETIPAPVQEEDAAQEDISVQDSETASVEAASEVVEAVTAEAADEAITPALDGGVTDTGEGQIIRKTTTNYFTTVIAAATATNSVTGETITFAALDSGELDGNISDENVQAVIEDYKAQIRAWADTLGTVQSIDISGKVVDYYYDTHDVITESKTKTGGSDVILVGDPDDLDKAYAAQGTLTVETILNKHQTYKLSGTITYTPKAKEVFIDNTKDASRSAVIGQVIVTDTDAGDSTTVEVYNQSAAVSYSNPKTAEVLAMITAAEAAAREYVGENGYTITVECVTTERVDKVWDNRTYTTTSDGDAVLIGDADYLSGAYGVNDDYTVTHIASGDYGKATTYTVTIEAAAGYIFLDGKNSTWTEGDPDLYFRVNGDYDQFTGVKVDGAELDPANYTSSSGSTIVNLKASYLAALSEGKHTLTVVYNDGEVSTDFTVKKAAPAAADTTAKRTASAPVKRPASAPKTGDESNIVLWAVMLGASLLGLGAALNRRRREN